MLPVFRQRNFLFCCFALLFSCNPNDKVEIENAASAFDIEQGKASIAQSNQNFMKAFKAADSIEISNCYSTDGKIMVANMPAINGREEIRHFISLIMNGSQKDFKIMTLKVWGDSSILAEEGTYILADSVGKQIDKGKYIVLWKPESGNWKMFRDTWTSDLPHEALPQKTK